ncbi:putative toxin-antitoxin system toxin component, PIN family [Candidatus Bathyarchaeota archaeon]|nr:putative toxin-antitoxin system toxin component, PIN family [Candidatus Bathyarchaeota archaeon]
MLVIVFDLNVLVPSLIVKGKPRDLWQKAKRKDFTLALSKEMLSELSNVIERQKFEKYVTIADIKLYLNDLRLTSKMVIVKSRFKIIPEDPDDDIIIRTAYDAKADYIVSGDRHRLELQQYKSIRIVTVDKMLLILGK